jgi:hypothetical protein
MQQSIAKPPAVAAVSREELARTALKIVWLAVALALVVEAVLFVIALLFGQEPAIRDNLSDLTEKITWSAPVCVAIGIGKIASRNSGKVMGLAGLLSAPVAFQVAQATQQMVARLIGGAFAENLALIAVLGPPIKGLEYGTLGWCLAMLGKRQAGLAAHLTTGFIVGAVAGAALTAVTILSGAPVHAGDLIGGLVDEILTTTGCAAIVFMTALFRNAEPDAAATQGHTPTPA